MQCTQQTGMVLVAALLTPLTPLAQAETTTGDAIKNVLQPASSWEGGLIVEGIYFDRSSDGEAVIEGLPSGGHAGHGIQEGLHPGHNELVVSGKLTDSLKARVTTAITEAAEDEGGGLEAELEEAYVETQGLGNGVTVKAGRFYSDVGYLSSKHTHEWDFADAPLVYQGLFGGHVNDDGVQLSYVAPTDQFLQMGTELFAGENFPAGKTDNTLSAATVYLKTGGDIGTDHSWQAGIGHWQANDIRDRSSAAHAHDAAAAETPRFSGDSRIDTVNAIYKWAPNGNARERNLKLQAEYFRRHESGTVEMVETDGAVAESSGYTGKHDGWYAQAIYQFRPHWRVGVRHDRLDINNSGDDDVLEEAGLASAGHTPRRNSLMLDYSPREYSRWRAQFNEDKSTTETDRQVILQYTHSFGSHNAHGF